MVERWSSGIHHFFSWASIAQSLLQYSETPFANSETENNAGDIHLRDFDGEDLQRWSGKKILLMGNGHSAANAAVALANVLQKNPATQLLWAVRTDQTRPVVEVPDDPLVERSRIVNAANALAQHPPENMRVLRRTTVDAFILPVDSQKSKSENVPVRVTLKVWKSYQEVEVDEIISLLP